ncbi:Pls/PosA family non-ribosomal peptide synthetase [Geodermatophilus sp. SYSU D00703]
MLREPPVEVLSADPAAPAVPAPSPGEDGVPRTATPVERALTEVLAEVVGRPVTPTGHFFDDLGADSMVMAQFCARLRKRDDLPSPSIKDVYQHPTIHALATALAPPPAASPVEDALVDVLADVVGRPVTPAGHFFDDLGADSMVMAQFCARVRKRPDLPSVSIKDVYQHPTIHALATALAPPPAASPVEDALVDVLADVVGRPVTPASHFFDDLGADSMVMATFCARLRKRDDLPSPSIKDVYAHPTVHSLATALAADAAAPAVSKPASTSPAPTSERRATTAEYVLCGVMQVLLFVGYSYVTALVMVWAFNYINTGSGLIDYERSVLAGGAVFLTTCLLPIAVKWLLIGRWKPQEIPIWTPAYLRFWLVKTLVASNPLVLFAGSPIYNLYLRALGAKVGRGAVVFTRHMPVATDLLTVGPGAVVRKECYLSGYRALAGVIQTGSVTLGRDAFVGDTTVLDIDTSVGDGAQLGHASTLHRGQAIPAGERWHGSPAEPTTSDYQQVPPADRSTWRPVGYAALQMLTTLLVYVPFGFGGVVILVDTVPGLGALLDPGPLGLTTWSFYVFALALASVFFVAGLVGRLVLVLVVPRLADLLLQPDRVYPMYGLRYSAHRTVQHFSNSKFFQVLVGDSVLVVHYLRSLGYRLKPYVQTGSNFGNEVKHESPYLVSVGRGTVAASGISFLNADYTSTSFRLSRTALGKDNFLGNAIVYPPRAKTGDNCLLATKVLVPIDGEVRSDVGLLGSPAFEIPRTVARDSEFVKMAHDEEFPRRLAAKTWYNLRTIGYFLLVRWVYAVVLTVVAMGGLDVLTDIGAWAVTLSTSFLLVFSLAYFTFVERAILHFRPVQPVYCSIYDARFWQRERLFKMMAKTGVHRLAVGTPFISPLWRLSGVRLGKRLFDDGHGMSEKHIVSLGDDVTLNAGSYIQCHTQEDYAFKSEGVTVGSGVTFGVGALAYYGAVIGDNAVLEADSFLMKGEEVPDGARWGGNPARELQPSDLHLPAAEPARTLTGHHDTGDAMQIPVQQFTSDGTTAGRHLARGRHRETVR